MTSSNFYAGVKTDTLSALSTNADLQLRNNGTGKITLDGHHTLGYDLSQGRRHGILSPYVPTLQLNLGVLTTVTQSAGATVATVFQNGFNAGTRFRSTDASTPAGVSCPANGNQPTWPFRRETGKNGPVLQFTFSHPSGLAIFPNVRYFFGVSDRDLTIMTDSDNPAGNWTGIQLNGGLGNNNYHFVTKNGTTRATQDTGITPAVDTAYKLVIRIQSTEVLLTLYDGTDTVLATHTFTTNLPTLNTAMRATMQVRATTAAQRQFAYFQVFADSF